MKAVKVMIFSRPFEADDGKREGWTSAGGREQAEDTEREKENKRSEEEEGAEKEGRTEEEEG